MASLLRAYNSALTRRPLTTQVVSAAVLFGTGDILAQQAIERRGKDHDLMRTARLSFYGGCIFAPLVSRWFKTLEMVKFRSGPLTIATRVGLDQFVAAPTVLVLFFSSMSFMEGHGMKEIENRLNTKWGPTVFKNWMVFIPVQALNFALVPVQMRLLVINVVSLFWNCYLSYANAAQQPGMEKMIEEGAETLEDGVSEVEKGVKKAL